MENVLTPLAKSDLIPVGLTTVAAATDAAIGKKMFGSGTRALIISDEEMEDILKIVKSVEESGLLIKGVSETIKNEAKQQKGGFLPLLLGTLAASLLGSASRGLGVIKAGEETIRSGNIRAEIQKYYQNEYKFNGVYSRNNISKITDGAYITNHGEYESIETHWIALYVNAENVTYFDSFGVQHIPKEIRKFIGNKNIIII